MTKPKAATPKPTRPNAHLEERLEAVKKGPGKLLKPKKAKVEATPEAPAPATEPSQAATQSRGYHPNAYGLRIEDGSLGLHAAPGSIIVVEPVVPAKAGLAVFYLKDRPTPIIFDLTRNFRPDQLRSFSAESEIMPTVEVIAPGTGLLGHFAANRIEKVHKIIGIQTPVDAMDAWSGRFPRKLPEFTQCPEGMGEHDMAEASAYPIVRPGETVIFDPSQRDLENAALCVLQWNNGTRDVMQTNRRPINREGKERWFVDPVNRSRHVEPGAVLYASDGPYTETYLREKIVGTVVGILARDLEG